MLNLGNYKKSLKYKGNFLANKQLQYVRCFWLNNLVKHIIQNWFKTTIFYEDWD